MSNGDEKLTVYDATPTFEFGWDTAGSLEADKAIASEVCLFIMKRLRNLDGWVHGALNPGATDE